MLGTQTLIIVYETSIFNIWHAKIAGLPLFARETDYQEIVWV